MEQYREVRNEETGELEALIPAVLKSVNQALRVATNTKDGIDKNYHLGMAEVTYPSGKKAEVAGSIWAKSITSNVGSFIPGATVLLTVQKTGEYKGFAKIGLPALAKVDLNAFAGLEGFTPTDDYVAPTPTQKEPATTT